MVDTDEKLAALVARLPVDHWIALDTEADSLHAYPEKLCLLQISVPGVDELVDPLARMNLFPLLECLKRNELILHGADYDLRLLGRAHGFVPRVVFDTMEAARLVGTRQFGLTDLVKKHLSVDLEKGPQKANWASRPLTERMQTYALNDTRFLRELADVLKTELSEKGRLEWHEETCARLVINCAQLREIDREQVWRLPGSHQLDRPGLAVLRELWQWREEEAVAANKPPYFIVKHETLVELASNAAHSHLAKPDFPRSLSPPRQTRAIAAIVRALALPLDARPDIKRYQGRQRNEEEKRRFHALKMKRDAQAAALEIDPTIIASRATLEALAADANGSPGQLMKWQRSLLF
ncbi:MAG: HRDC domain-containing protein [Verrucomicrobiota bacterium]